ncbi:MAG: RidA family protein [Bryobacteraceae bacterium]|nr:RidA family protein [Bryobacteraceae bacterium]MCX7603847.1 RidA family protein [Bryobacteraceae bacterium]
MNSVFRAAAWAAALVLLAELAAGAFQRRKKQKEEEEITQTLELPPEPPASVFADPSRLGFLHAPLSARGLLSQQTRDAIRALLQNARGARFVRIRAYVAGTGDLRRVPMLVSEIFSERKLPLPVVTVVQVGALPLEGAQVQLEAVVEQRKPAGAGIVLAAVSSQTPGDTFNRLSRTLRDAGARPEALASLVCGVTSPDLLDPVRREAAQAFPRTLLLAFQVQRLPAEPAVACEAAAPLGGAVPGGVRRLDSAVALSVPRVVFTGAQLAFRYEESDARLAFQRLERTLQQAGASLKSAVILNIYPLSRQLAEMASRVRAEFIDAANPPAGLVVPYEGLPSMDGAFALEAVALPAQGTQ